MKNNKTLAIIKPLAIKNGCTGAIITKINEAGFRILAMKLTHLTIDKAKEFYSVHKNRPFFKELVLFISSAPILVAILEKENAVKDYRELIGATNPAQALPKTIRSLYGTSIQANAVHGSDSDENAEIETDFFFSDIERF
jgi:nucleoside-diphosphate kinase